MSPREWWRDEKAYTEDDAINAEEAINLTSLTLEQAEALAAHDGPLYFRDLSSLSDSQAESLARHKGPLTFGQTLLREICGECFTLTNSQTAALAKHKGALDLSGLTELSDKPAEALAKYDGDLDRVSVDKPGRYDLALSAGGDEIARQPLLIGPAGEIPGLASIRVGL